MMNDQPSKKILFSKSTLLSLKAELYKKQEEVLEKKRLPQNRIENFRPPPASSKSSDGNKVNKEHKKTFKDSLKANNVEELEACRKSKQVLEKKAELYEHLSDSAGNSQLASRFLVDFKTKKDEEAKVEAKHEGSQVEEPVEYIENDDDDEWTEFTDCLGRTRKCLKLDVEMFKERDRQLMRLMFPDRVEESSETQVPKKETPLLVQKTNDYLQSLRQKWEEKERELMAKDKDIHYQDLLFDEARIHGVGYYAFSTDEAERKKQMEELMKQREATLQAQKQAEEARKKREAVMQARVKAAKARQRMRAGLPPEDPEENREQFTTYLLEFLTQQRNEADAKAKEEERKKKEELEKERQKLREAYVREWDIGKDGMEDKVKKFREMTQEEYVEQQRDKRIDEFAPLDTASSSKSKYMFDERGKMLDKGETPPKTWADVRPQARTPPPPDIGSLQEQKGLYFSTIKQTAEKSTEKNDTVTKQNKIPEAPPPPIISIKEMKYKNFVKPQTPTPIMNEISDDDDVNEVQRIPNNQNSGTEIAPPPTYDYYGPVPKKQKFTRPFDSDIREAYAQGTKSLEAKSSSRQLSKDYDFMFN